MSRGGERYGEGCLLGDLVGLRDSSVAVRFGLSSGGGREAGWLRLGLV